MNILKTILKGVGLLIILLLVAAFFVSNEMKYQSSVNIDAPIEQVWENVNSLSDLDKWSPWNEKDPNMEQTISGNDGTVGAIQKWKSDQEDVGTGSQEILKLEAPKNILLGLKFQEPFESEAQAFVKLEKEGNGTKATWGFESEMPYPMNLMLLFMDMEESIGADYQKGLRNLKVLSEKKM